MLHDFEGITHDLTKDELRMVPFVIASFKKYTKNTPITGPEVCRGWNKNRERLGFTTRLTEPRLRKICNYIRSHSEIPLIATRRGYYVSYNLQDIDNQILSLEERAMSILSSAEGLKKIREKVNV